MSGEELKPCPFCGDGLEGPQVSVDDTVYWMHPGTVTDGDCFMSGQGIFLRQLTAWNTRAAQSQPAATVQEAIDFKYWLMDAARILRSNGTDTHASWVEKALAALSPSKAVEPAPEQGREAELIELVKAIAVEAQKAGLDVMHMLHSSSCAALRALSAHPSPAPQQPQSEAQAAKGEAKPVAWLYTVDGWSHREVRMNPRQTFPDSWTETPLYAHPPAQPQSEAQGDNREGEAIYLLRSIPLDRLDQHQRDNIRAFLAQAASSRSEDQRCPHGYLYAGTCPRCGGQIDDEAPQQPQSEKMREEGL